MHQCFLVKAAVGGLCAYDICMAHSCVLAGHACHAVLGSKGQKPDVITPSVHVSAKGVSITVSCRDLSLDSRTCGQSQCTYIYWRVLKTNKQPWPHTGDGPEATENQPTKAADNERNATGTACGANWASASDNTDQPTPSTQPQLALFKQVLCTNSQPASQPANQP